MSVETVAPAETYKLNTLASVVGRYGAADLSGETLQQVGGMLDETIDDILLDNVPVVPHTNHVLLEEAVTFDRKLLDQVTHGPAARYLTSLQRNTVEVILRKHIDTCTDLHDKNASWQRLASPDAIASGYNLPGLWTSPEDVIHAEASRWGRDTQHPEVPAPLKRRVSLDETKELLSVMWRRVIQVEQEPTVNTYVTDKPQYYHVFWAPLAETLDYATPYSYDRATQLSFDLPHNATHLAHLDAMEKGAGAARYDDSMAVRAYFEAVTVFSEQQAYQLARNDPDFAKEIAAAMQLKGDMSAQEIAQWIAADRQYEFKLRAARYAADVLLLEGVSFDDTVSEVQAQFRIPAQDAEKETRKYIAWTGLGAAYTFGYRQLEAQGVTRVIDAIKDSSGNAITSWQQALKET